MASAARELPSPTQVAHTDAPASSAFDVFGSRIDATEPAWLRLAEAVRSDTGSLDEAGRADAHELLYPDLFSEYDARFLSRYVRSFFCYSNSVADFELWLFDQLGRLFRSY